MRRLLLALGLTAVAYASACAGSDGTPDGGDVPLPDRGVPEAGAEAGVDAACAADILADPSNCGTCGNICPHGANQTAACVAGKCVTRCATGYDDCDGIPGNGCERSVSTDSDNCGACKRKCSSCNTVSQTCAGGACVPQTVMSGLTGATRITLDAAHVYWTVRTLGGAIRRALRDGTMTENVVATVDNPNDLVVDGTFAYYTLSVNSPGQGVNRISLPNIVGPFPPFVSGQDLPGGIVQDKTGLYWTRTVGLVGSVMRCFNCGSSPTTVLGALPQGGKLALDDTSVVFQAADSVYAVDKTGQNQITLAISQLGVNGLASDGTTVWVARAIKNGEGGIYQVAKSGGPMSTLVPSIAPLNLMLDGTDLIFATATPEKAILRVDKAGHVITLARGLSSPAGVATDATCAWFIDGDKILKVTK